MKKLIIWVLAIAILVFAGIFAFKKVSKKKEEPLDVYEVSSGAIRQIVSATGIVKASKDVNLAFKASGKIINVNAEIGDKVEAGQDLAGLETSDLDSSAMEAEAAVKVAEAQLAEIKAGYSQEEIAVQQVAVSNAEINLAKAKESAQKAIASAEAQVASQQAAVDSKKQALEDAQISADNSLNSDYESALSAINSKYLVVSTMADTVNDMFDDDDLMNILGNLNYQSKIDANKAEGDIDSVFQALKPHVSAANSSKFQSDISSALIRLRSSLDSFDDSLEIIYNALLNTQPMVNIAKAELDAYKTSISAERTNMNSAIASVISAQQAISSTKISNTSALNAAEQALDLAEAALFQYQAALESTRANQDAAIASAEGSLASAKKQLEKMNASAKPETVAVYQARLVQSRAAYNSILKKYSDRAIIAPANGIISNIYKEEGESAAASEIIIAMIVENGFEIDVDIPEADIVKVGINNSCDITLDAFSSDEIFKGSVISINPAETVIDGVVYYKAKVVFSGTDGRIKPGMTANVDILTAQKEGIIAIPFRFIKEKDNKSIVKILLSDGSTQEREIKKGMRGEGGNMEIVEGIGAGEKIISNF